MQFIIYGIIRIAQGFSDLLFKRFSIVLLLCSGFVANSSALAQVALEDIEFLALPGQRFEIQLLFDAAPPEPEIFEVTNPDRLAMDFADVVSRLDERRYPLQFEIADSVMVLESQDRTRMVVNLTDPTIYSTRIQGNRMFVVVGDEAAASNEVAAQTGAQGTVTRVLTPESASDIALVDFHQGEDGTGQIVIELANNDLVGNIRQVGNRLELEFLNAELAESQQARLDVTDFGTLVQYIDVYAENGAVMIVADIIGEYEYIAFQGNQDYIINVTPVLAAAAAGTVTGSNYDFSGDLISLDYPDIPIRDALQILADYVDFSLVTSDSVAGNTTLRLDDVPWEQALDLVLRSGGLDRRMEGNVLYVAPIDELVASELELLQNSQDAEVLSPLMTEYIEVNYAVAAEIQPLLGGGEGGLGGILSSRGSASVDARTNTLIVQDVASVLVEVRELLAQLDVPVRQVLIEARIVNAETSFSESLGVRWSGLQNFPGGGDTFVLGGNMEAVTPFGGVAPTEPSLIVDLGTNGASSTFALGYAGGRGMLALELSALEDSGRGEVVDQPMVTVQDQQLARIESGVQIPYQAQAGGTAGGSTTEFVDAVLSLEVTPQITPDGRIIMLLDIHQDSVIPTAGGGTPAISTNVLNTRVLVDDGETIVLGGVFQEETATAVSKTMLLGDLPVVGPLFRRTLTTETKTELLIFITPTIINEFR